jgi:hypothetical protein
MKNRIGNTLRTGLVALALGTGVVGLGSLAGCGREGRTTNQAIVNNSYTLNNNLNVIYESLSRSYPSARIPHAFYVELGKKKIPVLLSVERDNPSNKLIRMEYVLNNRSSITIFPNHQFIKDISDGNAVFLMSDNFYLDNDACVDARKDALNLAEQISAEIIRLRESRIELEEIFESELYQKFLHGEERSPSKIKQNKLLQNFKEDLKSVNR